MPLGSGMIRCVLAIAAAAALVGPVVADELSGDDIERGLVIYADAANLQNGGAIEPAIETWQTFLRKFPDHPRAVDASHYLGVCHMQTDPPDYAAAAAAFEDATKAVGDGVAEVDLLEKTPLLQQSLVNLGLCYYSLATETDATGDDVNQNRLRQTIDAMGKVIARYPTSDQIDRAYFYSGEASELLGDLDSAIGFYDRLLTDPQTADSPLRCDAYYARGVTLQRDGQDSRAIDSYGQFLKSCPSDPSLVADVQSRRGDLMIAAGDYDGAVAAFTAVVDRHDSVAGDAAAVAVDAAAVAGDAAAVAVDAAAVAGDAAAVAVDDVVYALLRVGYANFAAGRMPEAIEAYERLIRDYPGRDEVVVAAMASAGAAYRDGQNDLALRRFAEVIRRGEIDAATEAAHWSAKIHLAQGRPEQAEQIADRQLRRLRELSDAPEPVGYHDALQFDLAKSVAADPDRLGESVAMFVAAAEISPGTPLAARAIYNAAFSAVTADQAELAVELTGRFLEDHADHPLATEVRLVRSEALLATDRPGQAADVLLELIGGQTGFEERPDERRGGWVMRAATALRRAGRIEEASALLSSRIDDLSDDDRPRAELMLGQLSMQSDAPEAAAGHFVRAAELGLGSDSQSDPGSRFAAEARLLAGEALQQIGQIDAAAEQYGAVVDAAMDDSAELVDTARFKLAGIAAEQDRFATAEALFDEVIESRRNPRLVPYAMLGRADALYRDRQIDSAIDQWTELLDQYPEHAVASRAKYDRGIALSEAGRSDEAIADLQAFLSTGPGGDLLAETLYELALLQQAGGDNAAAIESLRRLIDEAPDFDSIEDARYRLGWSLTQTGDAVAAREVLARLTTPSGGDEKSIGGSGNRSKSGSTDYRLEATALVGQTYFDDQQYEPALRTFESARQIIRDENLSGATLRDRDAERTGELVLIRGGQSAAQLGRHEDAIAWYDELRQRFPGNRYLIELFYELGVSHREVGNDDQALSFLGEVVENDRSETAAKARFVRGEIYFAQRKFREAIGEFQRLMFGFGSDKSPAAIRPWQAKAGFEAGRCSELLASTAKGDAAKIKAIEIAARFYRYVVDKHPGDALAAKAAARMEALKR